MHFALIDNQRTEAQPGLKGGGCVCNEPVIAKCGTRRIHHWAHQAKGKCDKWWERETAWHLNWKNKFSHEWQEVIRFDDQSSERHIADVMTEHGLVIEFQNSRLVAQERAVRERFYGNMVWVVSNPRIRNHSSYLRTTRDISLRTGLTAWYRSFSTSER